MNRSLLLRLLTFLLFAIFSRSFLAFAADATITVESSNAQVSAAEVIVKINGDVVDIFAGENNGTVELDAGDHEIEISAADGIITDSRSFSLDNQESLSITVSITDVGSEISFGDESTAGAANGAPAKTGVAAEEMLVLGTFVESSEDAITLERDASSVVDAIDAEDLARSGDSDAASALLRITGVSVVGGQFAVVRGLEGRYISSTLDGGLLPSTDFLRRDVPLDLFPANILNKIEIKKSYSPELPGDSTGGTVGLEAKGLPSERISKLSVSLGYNTAITGDDIISYNGGGRDALGFDDGTRDFPENVNSLTNFGREDLPDVCIEGLTLPGCVDAQVIADLSTSFTNNFNTRTTSASPDYGLAYAYGDIVSMGFGDLGYYGAIDYKHKWEARQEATEEIFIREGGGDFMPGQQNSYRRSKRKADLSAFFVIGTEMDSANFTSKTLLLRKTSDVTRQTNNFNEVETQSIAETTFRFAEKQLISQKFYGEHFLGSEQNHQLDWHLGMAVTTRDEPDRREYRYEDGNLIPTTIFRRYTDFEEEALDLGIDYIWDVNLTDSVDMSLKSGVYSARKAREFSSARFGYSIKSSINTRLDLESILTPENFNSGDVSVVSAGLDSDYFTSEDNVDAIYVSSEFNFNLASVLLGVRAENAEQTVDYPSPSLPDVEPLETEEVLPTLLVTLRPNDALQFRMGVSQTLSRPGLIERSNTTFFDPDTDERVISNPNLELSTIDNIDLRAEYYFADEDSISVALFLKDIDAPIEKTIPSGLTDALTFRNADSAEVLGIEIDLKKTLLDSDTWYGFVSSNVSFIDSEVTLDEESAIREGGDGQGPRFTRELQGQSDILANIQFGIDHIPTGQNFTVLVNHFGDRIFRVNNTSSGDEIELGRTSIDLVYKYEIRENLTIKSKIKNLLNEDVVYEIRGSRRRGTETYGDQGVQFSLGVDFRF